MVKQIMILITLYKALRKLTRKLTKPIYTPVARLVFYFNGAKLGKGLDVNGFLQVEVTRRGKLNIGNALKLNSGTNHNVIGRQQNCIFWVEGELSIGSNVGMSSSAIICNHKIAIGNNVVIGGNVVIYDTDFHVLDPQLRNDKSLDKQQAKKAPVYIEDNVFIGAHSTILKGVIIGRNSVIGACSVITKDVPANEIWAGNPARFVKYINV